MSMQKTSGEREAAHLFTYLSLFPLTVGARLHTSYDPSLSSAKRKLEISPLNSVSEKRSAVTQMITELRLAKTCTFCSPFPLSCAGRRDGIKSSGFSEEGTFEILPQGLGKQRAARSTPQRFREDQAAIYPKMMSRGRIKESSSFLPKKFIGILSQRNHQSKSWIESSMKSEQTFFFQGFFI